MGYPIFGYPDVASDLKHIYDSASPDLKEQEANLDNPLDTEVGGHHYKSSYQPVVLMETVRMYACCANILKYVFRHKNKNGKQDLEKALHYCDLLMSLGGNWYQGTSASVMDIDTSKNEFYKFIKANDQLDANQIRAILSISETDMEELKKNINAEITQYYG